MIGEGFTLTNIDKLEDMKTILGMKECCCTKFSRNISTEKGLEIKSGNMCLVQNGHSSKLTCPVFVRIYRNNIDHYAVVSKSSDNPHHAVFIRLKQCNVQRKDEQEISIYQQRTDCNCVTFKTKDAKEADEWMTALQPALTLDSNPVMHGDFSSTHLQSTLTEITEESDAVD